MSLYTVNIPLSSTVNLPVTKNNFVAYSKRMSDREKKIAEIKSLMRERGFKTVRALEVAAGLKKDAVRNLFRGTSQNWRSDTYLAVMKILMPRDSFSTGVSWQVDSDLMLACGNAIQAAAKSKGATLSHNEILAFTVAYYNHIKEYINKGEDVKPSHSSASLILENFKKHA